MLLVFIQALIVKFPVGRIELAGSLIILVLQLNQAPCIIFPFQVEYVIAVSVPLLALIASVLFQFRLYDASGVGIAILL